ncbi:MAG: ABC transporter permease subunit [Clostridiales Family XIII bacterium]|jgi:phosphonate transport system permease protein|nr:ABC transporter permease subunit [Clostridiales Family XIII bacterium]
MKEPKLKSLCRKFKKRIVLLAVIVIVGGATWFARFNPLAIFFEMDTFISFFIKDFFPPQFVFQAENIRALFVTVAMAFAASMTAFLIAGFLSFLGSDTTSPSLILARGIRAVASVFRNVPTLVWAFILFMSFGIGETIGFLALLISSLGFLTRAFIETLDAAAPEIREAAVATGATYWKRVFCFILPDIIPGYISWLLYNVELNIRSSSIVGMVGGGGIGLVLFSYIKMYRYGKAAGIIIQIALLVIAFECVTKNIRKRILS